VKSGRDNEKPQKRDLAPENVISLLVEKSIEPIQLRFLDILPSSVLKVGALAAKTSGGIGCRGVVPELQSRVLPAYCDTQVRPRLNLIPAYNLKFQVQNRSCE
jgi:hypothetical protein